MWRNIVLSFTLIPQYENISWQGFFAEQSESLECCSEESLIQFYLSWVRLSYLYPKTETTHTPSIAEGARPL